MGIFWAVSLISFSSDLLDLNISWENKIFNQQKAVYNDQTPLYATVARWVTLFKNDRQSIEDDTRSGRQITGFTKDNIEGKIKR